MNEERKKVLIIGVIGADVHAVGNKILYHAFTEAGFDVVGYTHGAAVSKDGKEAVILSAKPVEE